MVNVLKQVEDSIETVLFSEVLHSILTVPVPINFKKIFLKEK